MTLKCTLRQTVLKSIEDIEMSYIEEERRYQLKSAFVSRRIA